MKFNRISMSGITTSLDAGCLLLITKLLILTALFPERIPQAPLVASRLAGAFSLFIAGSALARRIPHQFLQTAFRTAKVVGLFSFLDQVIKHFQLLLVPGWMDSVLLSAGRSILGTEISLAVQQIKNSYLTEGLMFAYVAYLPLLPLTALLCYWGRGTRAAHSYLLHISLTFGMCILGFMVFPLASPTFHSRSVYSVPADGGFFAWCATWIHAHNHYPGGSLPSPHCAGTTVMLLMLFRYNRKAFYVLLPTFLLIYLATVYGRFHYVWDGLAGIVVAPLVAVCAPRLTRLAELAGGLVKVRRV